jgi:ADP-ribose pyrophosphatase
MKVEKTLSSKRVYQGRAVGLRVDEVEKPSGRRTTREIVEHADSVAVIPIDNEGNVLLVRQFRQATGKVLLEIPAGGINPGESLEEAVCREMREEIGFLPKEIKKIGGFYLSPGYSTEYLHLYMAKDLEPSRLHAEDTENIDVIAIPIPQIPHLIASEEIQDAKSIAGLYIALKLL